MVQAIAKDKFEKKCLDDIRNTGVHIMHVFEDDKGPAFSYSIGLFETYAHPEIIFIGLKHELAHVLVNNMAFDIKEGRTFTSGEYHEGILDDFLCYVGDVKKQFYRSYVGWDIWYYQGDDFPLVQVVFPTVSGKFVWEKDFPEDARWYCEMITDPPREH